MKRMHFSYSPSCILTKFIPREERELVKFGRWTCAAAGSFAWRRVGTSVRNGGSMEGAGRRREVADWYS